MEGRREVGLHLQSGGQPASVSGLPPAGSIVNSSPSLHTFLSLPFRIVVKHVLKENQSEITAALHIAPLLQVP